MPTISTNGITLAYDSIGAPDRETLLLISGLGTQMTRWTEPFCRRLVDAGYRVVRFDNRDSGLSTHFIDAGVPDFAALAAAAQAGRAPVVPYTLHDMAADAVGLLDALGIGSAHIVGRSMGGMIAQLVASRDPDRVLSLTTIMSSSGNPALPATEPDVMAMLMAPSPDPREDEPAFVADALAFARRIGSPGYPVDEAAFAAELLADVRRAYVPGGVARQIGAIAATGDLRGHLRTIDVPTRAIHGADDPLIPPQGSEDIARCIAGAALMTIDGMGHDLPPGLYATIADAIVRNARRTAPRGSTG